MKLKKLKLCMIILKLKQQQQQHKCARVCICHCMKQTILYNFVLLNIQNAVPILERNGAEACAIFRI